MDKAGIKHDPRNARKHNPRNLAQIESSIQRDGFGRSILLANDGTVIAGNATIDAAASAGLEDVIVVETDGTKVVAVKRTDVAPGSEQFHKLALADNRAAELAEWDETVLAELNEGMDLSAFFGDDELARVLATAENFHSADMESPDGGYTEQYGVIVICTSEAHQRNVFEQLQAGGHTVRVVTT